MSAAPAPAAANLVNLHRVSKSYGVRPILLRVSLGLQEGDRVGVVGRNGDGKTTLLRLMAGTEPADAGRVTRTRGLRLGMLGQHDDLDPERSVGELVVGDRAEHTWAANPRSRDVVDRLLTGVTLDRAAADLSGGEQRRVSLARLLLDDLDLLLLDEPTNHLDIEAVDWLAQHLVARDLALAVVTHDRWFLDAVCTSTWEVHDAVVDRYEGGYAAYVLARAERMRQAVSEESTRQNLVRKELAWLRRGAPARSTKAKFRVEAAAALIDDEPPPRDRLELQRFASTRLGNVVVDLEDVTIRRGGRSLVDRVTWRVGPGERIGLIGVNGAGKSSVLAVLTGELAPTAGRVRTGRTVALAHLSQHLDDVDPEERVLGSVESIRRVAAVAGGREVTAASMLEQFGFTGDRLTARTGDLSGGERRRLQLLRLLLSEPNVLVLDEPTNDLDIDTLTVVEDFLDSWPGTLLVVSHDRYFLERVCDTTWALLGDGTLAMLPGGVEEYVAARRAAGLGRSGAGVRRTAASPAAAQRAAAKDLARIERQLGKVGSRVAAVHAAMAQHAHDHLELTRLQARLGELTAEQESLEEEWLGVVGAADSRA